MPSLSTPELFSQSILEALAGALGETTDGLTGTEIELLLRTCKLEDEGPVTKRIRIYNAFVKCQNSKRNRTNILEFVRQSLRPERYIGKQDKFERMRENVNGALLFAGLQVNAAGQIEKVDKASTISEATSRASALRSLLAPRNTHPDVIAFCKAELMVENYFHGVQEAVKSVFDKIRRLVNSTQDGAPLVDYAFSKPSPRIAINQLTSESHWAEQSGFANLLKGTYGMFRTPTAHEARVNWPMTRDDAADLLTLVSMMHRRIDAARIQ